nr:hypothetical protein GCM10017745_43730 [Saccharothrix mutabilis subsp. capreolus]
MGSGYYAGTPLLIFVNAGVFADEAEAAEIVLHESLHQKLADIGVAREILRRGYVDEHSHRIPVPWGGDREFSVDRALAAYHVYTHQTVLYLSLLGHRDLVPQGPAVLARRLATSWARARHFAEGTATPGRAPSWAWTAGASRRGWRRSWRSWAARCSPTVRRCGRTPTPSTADPPRHRRHAFAQPSTGGGECAMESIAALEKSLAEMFTSSGDLSIDELGVADDTEVIAGDVREIRTDLSILAMNRPKTKS